MLLNTVRGGGKNAVQGQLKRGTALYWVATSVRHAETEMGDQKGAENNRQVWHEARREDFHQRAAARSSRGKHMESGGNVCPSKSGKQKEGWGEARERRAGCSKPAERQ